MSESNLIPIMPKMTSHKSPEPFKVEASTEYSAKHYTYYAFDRVLKPHVDQGWVSAYQSPINQQWVQMSFGESKWIDEIWLHQYRDVNARITKVTITYLKDGCDDFIVAQENIDLVYETHSDSEVYARVVLDNRILANTVRVNILANGGYSYYTGIDEIQLYTDVNKNFKAIIKDINNYKTISNGKLVELGQILPTPDIIQEKGFNDINDIINLGIINDLSDEFEIIKQSSQPYSNDLVVNAIPPSQLLIQNTDINLRNIETIHNIKLNLVGNGGIIKVAVSFDGSKYYVFKNGEWNNIKLSKSSIKEDGMSVEDIGFISSNDWNIALKNKKIRFAYFLEYNNSMQTLSIDNIVMTADFLGTWTRAVHNEDYDYEYKDSQTLSVLIKKDGTYKINYCEIKE